MISVTKISEHSVIEHTLELDITQEQLNRWQHGELIQKVMPNLSPGEREFLITGIVDEEWDEMFPKEEDE